MSLVVDAIENPDKRAHPDAIEQQSSTCGEPQLSSIVSSSEATAFPTLHITFETSAPVE